MSKKLKILMDHQIFSMQDYGGISRVFTELYKELSKDPGIEVFLPIILSDNEYLREIKKAISIFPKRRNFLKRLFYYAVNRIYTTIILFVRNFDVFQPTYYDPYFLPFLKKKPYVLVVHDMTHEIFPKNIKKRDKTIVWKKVVINKANQILAISQNTKEDIKRFYKEEDSSIQVVRLATRLSPSKKVTIQKLPEKYILFVGNRKGYKNFQTFIKSVPLLLEENSSLSVVCAGSSPFSPEEISLLKKLKVYKRVKHLRFKDDKELAYLYTKAECFVFPSLYEGFGLPILESFACNCPVIASNTSSLPEVAGDAAEYFNPKEKESIREAIKAVLNNPKRRKELIMKGQKRLALFSWEETAKSFVQTYRKVSST